MGIFNRSQQRVVLFLIASALISSAILILTHIQREKALSNIEVVHSAFEIFSEEIIPEKVDINIASLEELITLSRIGTVTAKRIIEYRQIHGKFKSIEEITRVKGIGPKTFKKIKETITVGNIPSGSITVRESGRDTNYRERPVSLHKRTESVIVDSITVDGSKTLTEKRKININTASVEELETLPQIGPATANKIINYRETHGNFQSIEEIIKVKGIGVKTFEKIKDRIIVKEENR